MLKFGNLIISYLMISSVCIVQGFNLLYYLENLVGSEQFGAFAKGYIQRLERHSPVV